MKQHRQNRSTLPHGRRKKRRTDSKEEPCASENDSNEPNEEENSAGNINAENATFYDFLYQNDSIATYYNRSGLSDCYDLKFLKKNCLLPKDRNVRILDVGSGDGRTIDYLLLERYINITGVELNTTAVERLYKKYKNDDRITIIQANIAEYEPEELYNFILWPWCGLSDFSKEKQHVMLRKIVKILSPGGIAVIDNPLHSSASMLNVESIDKINAIYCNETYSHTTKVCNKIYKAYIGTGRELRYFVRNDEELKRWTKESFILPYSPKKNSPRFFLCPKRNETPLDKPCQQQVTGLKNR